jgi:hypothetical protein
LSLFVVDASVAVRWLVQLPGHEEARALLTGGNRLVAPELLSAEVGSALSKLVRAKALSRAEGVEAFDDFFRAPVRMLPTRSVAPQALSVALKHGQSFYDCLHLLLAEAEQGQFATADRRFWNAMKATVYGKHMQVIGGPA